MHLVRLARVTLEFADREKSRAEAASPISFRTRSPRKHSEGREGAILWLHTPNRMLENKGSWAALSKVMEKSDFAGGYNRTTDQTSQLRK
jgi:hypothetical protein